MEIQKYFSKEKNSYVNYYEVIYYIPNCHTLFTFAKFPHVINIVSYNHPSYISPTRTFMYIIFHRFFHLYRYSCPISIILIVPEKYLLSYLATWLPSSGYRFNKEYFIWGILKVTQMLSCNSNINTLNWTIKQRYDVRVGDRYQNVRIKFCLGKIYVLDFGPEICSKRSYWYYLSLDMLLTHHNRVQVS